MLDCSVSVAIMMLICDIARNVLNADVFKGPAFVLIHNIQECQVTFYAAH